MTAAARWQLQSPTRAQLDVLAECWAVPVEELADPSRRWVQAGAAGDAPGPRVVELANRTVTVLPAAGTTVPRWRPRLTGLRGLVELGPHRRPLPAGLVELDEGWSDAVAALHARTGQEDLAAASPHPGGSELTVGRVEGDQLVGMAAVVDTPAGPPEVSVLVDPRRRGERLGLTLESALLGAAGGRWRWVQHRTVAADQVSQRLAARCGFTLVSIEHLVAPAAAS